MGNSETRISESRRQFIGGREQLCGAAFSSGAVGRCAEGIRQSRGSKFGESRLACRGRYFGGDLTAYRPISGRPLDLRYFPKKLGNPEILISRFRQQSIWEGMPLCGTIAAAYFARGFGQKGGSKFGGPGRPAGEDLLTYRPILVSEKTGNPEIRTSGNSDFRIPKTGSEIKGLKSASRGRGFGGDLPAKRPTSSRPADLRFLRKSWKFGFRDCGNSLFPM